jgi:hypothetical protein
MVSYHVSTAHEPSRAPPADMPNWRGKRFFLRYTKRQTCRVASSARYKTPCARVTNRRGNFQSQLRLTTPHRFVTPCIIAALPRVPPPLNLRRRDAAAPPRVVWFSRRPSASQRKVLREAPMASASPSAPMTHRSWRRALTTWPRGDSGGRGATSTSRTSSP